MPARLPQPETRYSVDTEPFVPPPETLRLEAAAKNDLILKTQVPGLRAGTG